MRSEGSDYPVAEREAYETAAGFELANQILEAASAIYVIVSSSRSPKMAEVCSAMDRVHGWLSELHDAVQSSPLPIRANLERATFLLDRTVAALRHFVAPSATVDVSYRARVAWECVESTAALLERSHDAWGDRNRFMAHCCAADIERIAESRNE